MGNTAGKSKRAKFKGHEAVGGDKIFGRVSLSMWSSEAWQDLNDKEKIVYICMTMERYRQRQPAQDYPNMGFDDSCFYFPWSMADKYKLYETSRSYFYRVIHNLEKHGFIETVANGKSTKRKSIYRFSPKWKEWVIV